MKTLIFALALAVPAVPAPSRQEASPPILIDLWPLKAPGDPEGIEEKSDPGEKGIKRVSSTAHPNIAVYRPSREKDTGAALVVAPGGGYKV
ncbi:MAG TPA: hypothetical protein VEN81_11720, partial [Planctomycetota bacterium]|nr:hypothetical protein [Planctomycetota bacterium]